MKPVRIQLSRKKGFNLQRYSRSKNGLEAVVVSRPSKWGNPFMIGMPKLFGVGVHDLGVVVHDLESVIRFHKVFCENLDVRQSIRRELRGKNLACWCKIGSPCHADALLEIANKP